VWSTAYVGPTFGSSQIWQMRQVWEAILAGEMPPMVTTLLTFPTPGAVVFTGWPFMALGLFFRLFMTTIPATNCALLLFLAAGGFTMFLLVWRCSGSRPASLLAGALYGFSTYALGSLANGHVYSMFVLWLPLLVLTYDECLRRTRPSTLALFGLVVLLSTLESPYRLIEASPILAALTIHFLTTQGQLVKVRWARVIGAALVCLIALAGPIAYFKLQVAGDDVERLYAPMHALIIQCGPAVHPGMESTVDGGLIAEGWLDPVSLVRPGFLYRDSVAADVHNAHHIQYLGLLLPLVIIALLALDKSRRQMLLWAIVLGGALALGPALHWGGVAICIGGRPLPGPLAFLGLIPGTDAMGAYYRFYLGILAAVLLSIALVWPAFLSLVPRRIRPWFTAFSMVLLLADATFFSPLRFPIPVVDWEPPPAAVTLADQPGKGGVLVVPDIHGPSLVEGEERLCAFVWQFHTRKPMLFRIPETCAAQPLRSSSSPHEMVHYATPAARDECLTELHSLGIEWVLFIGPNATAEGQQEWAIDLLSEWFGPPIGPNSDDGSRLFDVP